MNEPPSSNSLDRRQHLFEEALELSGEKQRTFLSRECGEDLQLRKELDELLSESQPVLDELDDLEQNLILPALDFLRKNPEKLNVWMDSLRESGRMADSLIGEKISHYEIRQLIGRGGMGMVYRAYDQALDREVALKFLPPSFGNDTAAKERFIQEAKAASGLDHPNIAAVHEIGETENGQMFIAMGYYPGETLKAIIEKGSIPVDKALDITIQIASALKEAHGHGIIHRDIKPGNFIMSPDGTIHLLDFGLAKLSYASGYTQIGLMMGTIAYMSPEQAKGKSVDHRTDIWSLGVVLHELVTGKRPFGGEDVQSAIHDLLFEEPVSLTLRNQNTKPLGQVIRNCLAKDPDERYEDAGKLLEDLLRVKDGLVPRKQIKGRRGKWRTAGRQRAVPIMATLAIIIAAVIIILNKPKESHDEVADAIRGLRALHERDPVNISPCIEIASLFASHYNQFDKAMFWLRKAHELQPDNTEIHQSILDILYRLGDYDNAAWWTNHFLDLAPHSYLAQSLEIRSHLLEGELEKAVDAVLAVDPDELDLLKETRDLVLETLVKSENHSMASSFIQSVYPPFLVFDGQYGNGANLTIVNDPVNGGKNHVLRIEPGPPTVTGKSSQRTSIVRRLPEDAWNTASASEGAKDFFYFKLGCFKEREDAGPVHIIFGLASGDEAPDYPLFHYADYSVQARVRPEGNLHVRDKNSYIILDDFPMEPRDVYEFWFAINHDEMSYDLYVRGGRQFPRRTLLYEDAGYRKPTSRPLDHFVLNVRGGAVDDPEAGKAPVYIDDIRLFSGIKLPDTSKDQWITLDDFEKIGMDDWIVSRDFYDSLLGMKKLRSSFLVACGLHANGQTRKANHILDTLTGFLEHNDVVESLEKNLMWLRIHSLRGNGDLALQSLQVLLHSGQMSWYRKGLLDGYEFVGLEERARMVKLMAPWDKELDQQLGNIQAMGAVSVFTPMIGGPLVNDAGHFFGASWGDYDNDGQLDVAVAVREFDNVGGYINLYRNNANGSFNRIDESILPDDSMNPSFPCWVDPDNDGSLDLFVTAYGPNLFYRNTRKGKFIRETGGIWLNRTMNSLGSFWGDYDNDGFLDLFVTNSEQPDFLYHNMGNGTMEPVPWEDIAGLSNAANWSDYDLDGDLDLFVSGNPRVQYRNDGAGDFTWIPPGEGGLPYLEFNVNFAMADFDNDGDLDIAYATGPTNPSEMIYRNEGDSGFARTSGVLPPLDKKVFAISAAWGDYDNDGWQDLFLTTMESGRYLYHNEGDGSFSRVIDNPLVNSDRDSIIPLWVDFDNDGDLDLFVTNGGFTRSQPCELFLNHSGPNNWIGLILVGTVSNVQGTGAKVHCTATIWGLDLTQLRELSQYSGSRAHFGLGDAEAIESLTIEWPSGIIQELKDVAVNQILTIVEPEK